jgi:uncharacterized glyoxalase superfamily protein PhnB
MKDTPHGWPRISPSLCYDDASEAIDWLCRVFGFEVRLKVEGDAGQIVHSELVYGDGVVMVGSIGKDSHRPDATWRRSPREVGGANTQSLMVFVDDVEAHCANTRAGGAKIVSDPKTSDYGEDYWTDRSYEVEDLGGHHWWFVQRLSGPKSDAR